MELQEKIDLIKNNETVAMLAPSFAIDFKYPNIIGMLRHLGFKDVTELTFGARMVNWVYANYIKEHLNQKLFIASPCPIVVALVKNQYPEFAQYLMPFDSPMVATAKIYKKYNPGDKAIFISPCIAKENVEMLRYKDLNLIDAVITLNDLKQIFNNEGIKEKDFNRNYYFNSFIREYTKIYPMSGGLAATSHISKLFEPEEILVTDGVENIKKVFEEIKTGQKNYRFLDILNCNGGCIGGPAINNKNLSAEEKKRMILEYTTLSSKDTMGKHEGKIDYADDINFTTSF
jgi:iron only hydrogenase large subunit-like protein